MALEHARGGRKGANELLRQWQDNSAGSISQRMNFIEHQLNQMGVEFNREETQKELKKYC